MKKERDFNLGDVKERMINHPFAKMLGIEIENEDRSDLSFSVEIKKDHLNPIGLMHGGVALSLADTAGGVVIAYDGQAFVTINQEYQFFRPVNEGEVLIARPKLLKDGRTIRVAEVSLWVEDKNVGHAIISYFRVDD